MSQQERIETAQEVEVEDVREVRDGVFSCNFINDRGEERKDVVLFPRKIMSETGDMVHRPHFVGKYLIATAQENEDFKEQLIEGIGEREQELLRESELVEERKNLEQVVLSTKDSTVSNAAFNRILEIHNELDGKDFEYITEELGNIRQVASFLGEDLVKAEEGLVEFVGEEQPIVVRQT